MKRTPVCERVPRAYTPDEIRDMLLKQFWGMARYWAGLDGSNVDPNSTPLDRTSGFLHSMLATLDGSTLNLPAFNLVAAPHPEDPEYLRSQGENWFEPGTVIDDTIHEHMFRNDIRQDGKRRHA